MEYGEDGWTSIILSDCSAEDRDSDDVLLEHFSDYGAPKE
jgi:hypothetical protein